MDFKLSVAELANMIDHTLLKADAREDGVRKLCDEAMKYGFKMVAVNTAQVALSKRLLLGSPVHVGATISFPLGQSPVEVKVFETQNAIENGADEIDYVINIGKLKDGDVDYLRDEMARIVEVCRRANVISKVIFENCYLTREEIKTMSEIALEVRPDFIKTSTGFGTYGARVEDVALMKSVVGDKVKVKAAGGIRDLKTTIDMINAGAERIGTSAGVRIAEEYMAFFKGEHTNAAIGYEEPGSY